MSNRNNFFDLKNEFESKLVKCIIILREAEQYGFCIAPFSNPLDEYGSYTYEFYYSDSNNKIMNIIYIYQNIIKITTDGKKNLNIWLPIFKEVSDSAMQYLESVYKKELDLYKESNSEL